LFNKYYDLFYKENKNKEDKIYTFIPVDLAYWIMDYKGKPASNQTVLHTR
jgi:hypothetical protein